MRGQSSLALHAFYQLTRGDARTLGFEQRLGALERGREADVVVLDPRAAAAMVHRMQSIDGDLAEELFVLMTMGDDRAMAQTISRGAGEAGLARPRYDRFCFFLPPGFDDFFLVGF
ncbi:MAG TPA: hypothetical protein VN715_15015 [Roseiarcus sp.]|nr:hypothetical protein [Roseiarcus sp.]